MYSVSGKSMLGVLTPGFVGSEGAGPKCRHGWKPGVNLKGLFYKEKSKSQQMLEKAIN